MMEVLLELNGLIMLGFQEDIIKDTPHPLQSSE